jgi:hypothetical protein
MAYRYQKLSEGGIRLVNLLPGRFDDSLQCQISEIELSSNLGIRYSYEALSYVWGDQSNAKPLYIVHADGSPSGKLALGPNLYSALLHMRFKDSSRTIWCDLISINQVDLEERSQQIVRMGEIYRKARRVVVWLGPEADESRIAMNAIRYTGAQIQIMPKRRTWQPRLCADPRFTWEAQQVPLSKAELQAIHMLIQRDWFKRLWVRQEVTLAKSPLVMVGAQTVTWEQLISTAAFLDEFIRLRGNNNPAFGRDLFNLLEFGYMKAYEEIMEIFHACRACECTENHDRVYGLLGLLSSQRDLAIEPDYKKTPKMVYQDFVIHYYQRYQKLNILTLCEEADTPSWVPDFHKLRLNTGLNTRVAQYCWASGDAAASLVLHGDGTMETYGARCGTLGKLVAPPIDKHSEAGVLKSAIVRILVDHMGAEVSSWENERLKVLTMGLLGCLWTERTGRKNHSSLPFALSEIKNWAQEENDDMLKHAPVYSKSVALLSHIVRVLFYGDSCRWTQDGYIGLGYQACQEGDLLYAILGCRRLIALRKLLGDARYRVVGKFDHPRYNDGEAFLGQLPSSWSANYKHLLVASNRPRFTHEDGRSQWQDPRLDGVSLSDDWQEGQDEDGIPYWFNSRSNDPPSYTDPRLTWKELERRGINLEKITLV